MQAGGYITIALTIVALNALSFISCLFGFNFGIYFPPSSIDFFLGKDRPR